MLVGKWIAFLITDSTAIFSDAAESVVHIAATAIAAFSLWYAKQPADRDHLYGHGKIAYFSAGIEGGLITFAALTILYTGVYELIAGPELKQLSLGLAITAGLALLNLLLGLYLIRTGRKQNSVVLVANGKHVLTDMWTSVGVVVGVLIVELTGIDRLDPIVGILAGLQIAWSGVGLLKKSYDGLMDTADPETRERLVSIFDEAIRDDLIGSFHQLRFRYADDELWIEVHLLLPGSMSVEEGHRRVTVVEERIRDAFQEERVYISSHLEPLDHERAHPHGHRHPDPLDGASGSTADHDSAEAEAKG